MTYKIRRRLCIAFAGLSALLCLASHAAAQSTAPRQVLHDLAATSEGRSEDGGQLVAEAVARLQTSLALTDFQVNGAYRPGALNIYVYDGRYLAEQAGLPVRIAAVRTNFVAIAPNVVLIDADFLVALVVAVTNQLGQELEILITRTEPFSPGARRRSLLGNHMLRVANFGNFADAGSEETRQIVWNDYRRLGRYRTHDEFMAGERARVTPLHENLTYLLIAERLAGGRENWANVPYRSPMVEAAAGILAFILLHEVGHLDPGLSAGPRPAATAAPENDADRFAAQRLQALLSRRSPDDVVIESGLRTTALALVDMVAMQLFDGFRDLDAQKFGFFIHYDPAGDCTRSVRGFFDFNLITEIAPTMLPLFAEDELAALFRRGRQMLGSAHSNNIVRSGLLVDVASAAQAISTELSEPQVDRWRQHRSDAFEAILNQDAAALGQAYAGYFRETVTAARTGIAAGDLLTAISNAGFSESAAPACPAERCSIFRHADTGQAIEMVRAADGSVLYLRLYAPQVVPRTAAERQAFYAQSPQSEHFERAVRLGIVFIAMQRQLGLTSADIDMHADLITNIQRCGFASYAVQRGGHRIRASTLSNASDIQFEFIAGPHGSTRVAGRRLPGK